MKNKLLIVGFCLIFMSCKEYEEEVVRADEYQLEEEYYIPPGVPLSDTEREVIKERNIEYKNNVN